MPLRCYRTTRRPRDRCAVVARSGPGDIRAIGRNEERLNALRARGFDTRRADLRQQAEVDATVSGADTVMLVSGTETGQRVQQHRAVINAAVAADVSALVDTSAPNATTSAAG